MNRCISVGSFALLISMAACGATPELGREAASLSSPGQRVGRASSDLTSLLSFDGPAGAVQSGLVDASGSVGPSHYVVAVNTQWAVYGKTGTIAAGFPRTLNSLFASHQECQITQNFNHDAAEPIVRYDGQSDAGRWLIAMAPVANVGGALFMCVAISQTGDPTLGWNVYSFQFPSTDYPKLAVWPDAYYMTMQRDTICAIDRASMLAGAPARPPLCDSAGDGNFLLASDLDGSGSTEPPPAGSPNFVSALVRSQFYYLGTVSNALKVYSYKVDFAAGTHALTPLPGTPLTVDDFLMPCTGMAAGGVTGAQATCLPQVGTSAVIEVNSIELMQRAAYRRFQDAPGVFHESIVLDHTVSTVVGPSYVTGVRWYELRGLSDAAGPIIAQSGLYAPADGNSRFNASAAMDRNGDIALGFSIAGPGIHPGVHYTGWRNGSDPPGIMNQGEGIVVDGGGNDLDPSGLWGEYSQMTVDPSDDCTFWYSNMYSTGGAMPARIGSFRFPGCAGTGGSDFALTVTPPASTTVQQPLPPGGQSLVYQVTPIAAPGSAAQSVLLGLVGLPGGVSAAWSPPGATVTSCTTAPSCAASTATLTLSATGAVTGPMQTFTITGTSGAIQHAGLADITVTGTSVFNGGFESGGFSDHFTGWNELAGLVTPLNSGGPHSGGWYVRLGSPDGNTMTMGDNTLTQTLVVPGSANQTTTLAVWYRPNCNTRQSLDANRIDVVTAGGAVVHLLDAAHTCTATGVWTQVTGDLTPYVGQTVTLQLVQHNIDSTVSLLTVLSQLDIDDVALTVQ